MSSDSSEPLVVDFNLCSESPDSSLFVVNNDSLDESDDFVIEYSECLSPIAHCRTIAEAGSHHLTDSLVNFDINGTDYDLTGPSTAATLIRHSTPVQTKRSCTERVKRSHSQSATSVVTSKRRKLFTSTGMYI